MKIRIHVSETRLGYIDVEIDDDSPLLDTDKSVTQKHRLARKLGNKALEEGVEPEWLQEQAGDEIEVSGGFTIV